MQKLKAEMQKLEAEMQRLEQEIVKKNASIEVRMDSLENRINEKEKKVCESNLRRMMKCAGMVKQITVRGEWWRIRAGSYFILNGKADKDAQGEFTYVGERGSSVIDYIIVNEDMIASVDTLQFEDKVELDRIPLSLELNGEPCVRRDGGETEVKKPIHSWTIGDIASYEEKSDELTEEVIVHKEDSVENRWGDIKEMAERSCDWRRSSEQEL
ncbi:hypothetical protein QAD02_006958 [Eretmocerus hayati]|uniref:Uncharacterized protein n=1 Tax=Eretmocerus hayati TaxID=131215 RepID=A0ACC2N350_9HYME|nr:hypothetical protein QAD02_006958 [Eretmocerus hayati]